LQGQYLFTDFCNPAVRALSGPMNGLIENEVLPAGQMIFSSFGEDDRGELYGADFIGGAIYRLVASESSAYAQQVQRLYIAYYGRPADPAGIDYWVARLAEVSGAWSADLVDAFANSPEYRDRYGSLDEQTLINNLFLGLFNRSVDAAGLAYYVDLLNGSNLSGLNPELRQSTLAQIALDIANGVQLGTEDARTLNNKLSVATAFTVAIRTTGTPYSNNELSAAVDLIADVNAQASSVTTAQGTIAQMMVTPRPVQSSQNP